MRTFGISYWLFVDVNFLGLMGLTIENAAGGLAICCHWRRRRCHRLRLRLRVRERAPDGSTGDGRTRLGSLIIKSYSALNVGGLARLGAIRPTLSVVVGRPRPRIGLGLELGGIWLVGAAAEHGRACH
jgi:hypothetical protein